MKLNRTQLEQLIKEAMGIEEDEEEDIPADALDVAGQVSADDVINKIYHKIFSTMETWIYSNERPIKDKDLPDVLEQIKIDTEILMLKLGRTMGEEPELDEPEDLHRSALQKRGSYEELDETSLSSAVQGAPASIVDLEKSKERELRKVVQEVIKNAVKKKIILERKILNEERKLRTIIQTLIKEAKKDIEAVPHSSTAINILEDMLKQILPNLEKEYKTLTTKKEQRDSFRAHIVNAVSTLLETEDVNKEGGSAGEEGEMLSLDEEEIEEIEIKVSDTEAPVDDKFIDIEGEEPIPEEEEDTFGIEGQDRTGRALAQEAFGNMEKNIVETYAILHDEDDEKLFKDYLITNLKLYLDKWEKELGTVTEPTTDEYETEKAESEAGDEAGAELGGELGGEFGGELSPTPPPGEELIQ